jgi:UDP-N-acetyl-D-glucosamine/UDP-N-acetyl-D-galactosamine dehydrogenase
MNSYNIKIGIIGLGYVGLPLAIEFSKFYRVVGFDINASRIDSLLNGIDSTLEIESSVLREQIINPDLTNDYLASGLVLTNDSTRLSECTIYIITVPTPVNKFNSPVLTPLFRASDMVGKLLKKNDTVIYESTVYPGVTEDLCVPILQESSGLKFNSDFFVGYSPERINPGDKEKTLTKILKVTSGSTPYVAELVDALYASIITAGTFKASSIKVAEAAKVIENSQRDINIAFVNELSKIFNLLDIDTNEVLEAAGTKWNFLPFKPGLAAGHCIGVDPYYLAQKALEVGYHPEIILAGRRLNDSMGKYVATEVVKLMMRKDIKVVGSKILILGFTFKENCPDVRNTRVIDIYRELASFDTEVDVYDPWASAEEIKSEFDIDLKSSEILNHLGDYSAVILAVSHREFSSLDISSAASQVVYDVKGFLPKESVDGRL